MDRATQVYVRTTDLVLPNPAGAAYRALEAGVVDVNGQPVAAMDGHGLLVYTPLRTFDVPWYYMMDDQAIRPYHILFWDTGTAWYVAWAEDLWGAYAPLAAPGMEKAMPFGAVRSVVPDVHVQTVVDEVALAARVGVLLHSALEAAGPGAFARPDAPLLAEGTFALAPEPALAAPAPLGPNAAAGSADWQALPSNADTGAVAQLAAPPSLVAVNPAVAAAAMGAMGIVAVAAYHLIRKSAILKNKVRSTIAEHVLHHPGSTITEIAQAVGVTHQTASYHLRLLQEHGLVLGVERGNKRLYFRNDGSFNQEERKYVAVLRDAESMRVLTLIRTNPWIMKNEAAASLGVSRNTLNWHLQKLIAAGLVSEARENGYCFLFCNRKASDDLLGTVAQKVEERKGDLPSDAPENGNGNGNGNGSVPAPPPPGLFTAGPSERQHLG
ncbi:MAG TPA: helix-turn-helix domain-containing protein [Candidatus Thermoplasmatota archaeon]|nr:helix-turn-helix domain-containing protein [Candidatus Thermoplasmatota archaeon]